MCCNLVLCSNYYKDLIIYQLWCDGKMNPSIHLESEELVKL